jgi:hypothetical protein
MSLCLSWLPTAAGAAAGAAAAEVVVSNSLALQLLADASFYECTPVAEHSPTALVLLLSIGVLAAIGRADLAAALERNDHTNTTKLFQICIKAGC